MFDPTHSVRQKLRRRARLRIVPYRSVGTPESVSFRGRVLANPVSSMASLDQRTLRSVARMITRFTTFEVESVAVLVEFGGDEFEGVTDREGYFEIQVPLGDADTSSGWVTASASLPGRQTRIGKPEGSWQVEARVFDPATERLVISDIDDTLLLNGVGDTAQTIIETVRGNFLTRKPVPGTPTLYQWLTDNGRHPIAYVSSSPWNLYDFLTLFMKHNGFPKGPLFLRDFGFNRATLGGAHGSHKVAAIQDLVKLCPSAEVILIGDSSQQDAEAFATIIRSNSHRNIRAFVRNVGDPDKAHSVEELRQALESDLGRTRPLILVDSMEEIRPLLT